MHLSNHDLQQLDESSLGQLSWQALLALSAKLLADLKEAHDRLNRTPENSSQPPRTQKPWERAGNKELEGTPEEALANLPEGRPEQQAPAQDKPHKNCPSSPDTLPKAPPRRPGRQPGAPGVSRTQELPVTAERTHSPEQCARLSHKNFTCLSIDSKSAAESANLSMLAWKFFVEALRSSAIAKPRSRPIIWA